VRNDACVILFIITLTVTTNCLQMYTNVNSRQMTTRQIQKIDTKMIVTQKHASSPQSNTTSELQNKFKHQLTDMRAHIERLEAENASMTTQLNRANAKVANYQQNYVDKAELNDAAREIEQLTAERDVLQRNIQRLHTELEALHERHERDIDALRAALEDERSATGWC
jgi:chromosome segregation ATPase